MLLVLMVLGNEVSQGATDEKAEYVVGWIMLSVDLFVFLTSLIALFAMLVSFREHMKKLKDRPEGTDSVSPPPLQQRSRVKVFKRQPTRKLTASMVETAVTHNKVKVFEMRHEDARRKGLRSTRPPA